MRAGHAARGFRTAARPPARRWRAVLAAGAPTARAAHLGPAALTIALAAAPVVATMANGNPAATGHLVVAGLLGGAALGWSAEDPAAELLTPLPVSAPIRATIRATSVAAVAAVGLALLLLAVALGPGLPADPRDRGVEATAAAAVALAVGHIAAHRGVRGIGPPAVAAGILGPGIIAILNLRWPQRFPTFATSPTHSRWWILTAIGLAAAIHAGRDPGRR